MASSAVPAPLAKPSFAKVAAAANDAQKSKSLQHTSTVTNGKSEEPKVNLVSETRPLARSTRESLRDHSKTITANDVDITGSSALESAKVTPNDPSSNNNGLLRTGGHEDGITQLSSSDSSNKPPSLDGKSVISGTTFTMDDKESLRPDDSASVKASEDDEHFSPSGSVLAGTEARAFRDQLHQISSMGPLPQRAIPPMRFGAMPPSGVPAALAPAVLAEQSAPLSDNGNIPALTATPTGVNPKPDEKLLDALASPNNRLWVLKLEQDIIDFMKDPKVPSLDLPQCNAFYRMLAHRLADYYLLGHTVDNSMGAVRLHKTPMARLAPPLGAMPIPSTAASTPPPVIQARTILRRTGEDGKSHSTTAATSQSASKATSEADLESVSEKDPSKSKQAMTREEREARYAEARIRILGAAKSDDHTDDGKESEAKDVSRSSSANGKKKSKKQRSADDDGFEGRSQYQAYLNRVYNKSYPGQIEQSGLDPYLFNPMAPHSLENGLNSSSFNVGMIPGALPDPNVQWPANMYGFNPPSVPSNYQPHGQNTFDLSAEFQRNMTFGQPPFNKGSSNMGSPRSFSSNLPLQPPLTQWQFAPMPHAQQGQFAVMQNAPIHYNPSAPPAFFAQPASENYNFAQAAGQGFGNGTFPGVQHSLQSNFHHQKFNPRTQDFVPGSQFAPSTGPYGTPRTSHAQPHAPVFGGFGPNGSLPNQNSPPSNANARPIHLPSATSLQRPPNGPHQMNNKQSSLAKFGNPASLPAKPPPSVLPPGHPSLPAKPASFSTSPTAGSARPR